MSPVHVEVRPERVLASERRARRLKRRIAVTRTGRFWSFVSSAVAISGTRIRLEMCGEIDPWRDQAAASAGVESAGA